MSGGETAIGEREEGEGGTALAGVALMGSGGSPRPSRAKRTRPRARRR